jgi:hypothetical protein
MAETVDLHLVLVMCLLKFISACKYTFELQWSINWEIEDYRPFTLCSIALETPYLTLVTCLVTKVTGFRLSQSNSILNIFVDTLPWEIGKALVL